MSYEPTEWVKGTKITATKLNNIEQGVQSVNSEYTPTTWAEGDIVTSTKLNNIEQGIANASGGGGDSDFSTATVTFVDNDQTGWQFQGPFLGTDFILPFVYSDEANTQTAVLYKGLAVLECQDDETFTVSGNAEKDELRPSRVYVTGDCTITIPSDAIA